MDAPPTPADSPIEVYNPDLYLNKASETFLAQIL